MMTLFIRPSVSVLSLLLLLGVLGGSCSGYTSRPAIFTSSSMPPNAATCSGYISRRPAVTSPMKTLTTVSSTQLGAFGWGKKKPPQPTQPTPPEKKKEEPFVFLIGRPQYDWVNNKTERERDISYVKKMRMNWLVKPEKEEKKNEKKK